MKFLVLIYGLCTVSTKHVPNTHTRCLAISLQHVSNTCEVSCKWFKLYLKNHVHIKENERPDRKVKLFFISFVCILFLLCERDLSLANGFDIFSRDMSHPYFLHRLCRRTVSGCASDTTISLGSSKNETSFVRAKTWRVTGF